jgi:phosphoesterase RecJ-like protein
MLNTEEQIVKQIEKAQNILLAFSLDWNGDAIASALALYLYFKKIGKQVTIAADQYDNEENKKTNPNVLFSFLPEFNSIDNSIDNLRKFIVSIDITNSKINQIKYKIENNMLNFIISPKEGFFTADDISFSSSGFKHDLIITLGTSDLESLGSIYDNNVEFFYKTPIVNIDHSPSNEEYGQINLIDLNAVSVSEIIFYLLESLGNDLIDEEIATCLLTGIIYKTRSFKTNNLTPHTLAITSRLINLGARREEIVNRLYRSRDFNVLKLWGRILDRLQGLSENQIIWSKLYRQDFAATNASEENLRDLVDELITNIPQAKVVVIFYENKEGSLEDPQTNVITYSIKNISSVDIIKEFEPTGTKKIAQTTIHKIMDEAESEVITLIRNKLDKLPA